MSTVTQQKEAIDDFEAFASTVEKISKALTTKSLEDDTSKRYLLGKLSESLAFLVNKDFDEPRYWQALQAYVNTGLMLAAGKAPAAEADNTTGEGDVGEANHEHV